MSRSPTNLELLEPTRPLSWASGFAQVARLSGPIIPAMLAQMAMNFFDAWMVGQIGVTQRTIFGVAVPLDTVADPVLSKAALAAVVPAAFMTWAVMCTFVGTVTAVNTFAAQAYGRGQPDEAGRYAWQSIHFAMLTVLVVAAAWWLAPWFFGLFAPNETVLGFEVGYFRIRILSLPAVVVVHGIGSFFQGVHRPLAPAIVGVASNLLNIALNWALVYGRLGLPRMGMAGAAAATLIATLLGLAVLAVLFLIGPASRTFHVRATWRPSLGRLGRLVWIGLPSGASWLLDMIGWSLLIIVLVQRVGETAAAASNAAMTYLQLGFMPVVGVGLAVTALVGKAIGQRRPDHARRFAACGFAVGGVYQLLIGVLLIVYRHELIRFFSDDPEVIRLGGYALIFAGLFQFSDAMGIVYAHALRGAGDTHFLLTTNLALTAAMFVPLALLADAMAERHLPWFRAVAPWAAGTLYIIALGAAFYLRWRRGRWERIDIFRGGEAKSPTAD